MSNQAQDTVYCRDCGEEIDARAEICPECGIRQREPETSSIGTGVENGDKNSGLAAAASFVIPGLGQVYNGEIGKGIVLGAITVLLVVSLFGAIIGVPLWIWLVYDAYKTAESEDEKVNSEQNVPRETVESQPKVADDELTGSTKEQDSNTPEKSSTETVSEEFEETSPTLETTQEPKSDGINWRVGIQIFIGLVIFLVGAGLTIQSPLGIPIALIGLAIVPAAREWGMEKLGSSTA